MSRVAALGQQCLRKIGRFFFQLAGTGVFAAVPVEDIEWRGGKHRTAPVTLFMKFLYEDTWSGNEFKLVRYPAGEINPDHTHNVPHGMYILRGQLVTHKGTYGPDTFVWFPANEVMRHGAGPDEEVVVLFVSLGEMRTDYVKSA